MVGSQGMDMLICAVWISVLRCPLWVKSSRSVSEKYYHLSGWYWGIPDTRHSVKEAALGKMDVKDTLIRADASECLLLPIPDTQIMEIRGN